MSAIGRRLFVLAFFGLLSLPLLNAVLGQAGDQPGVENRPLAPLPSLPDDPAPSALPGLLRGIDAWLADHFGGRAVLVRANAWIRFRLFGESPSAQLVIGRDGRLFLGNHDGDRPYSLIRSVCGVTQTAEDADHSAAEVARLLAQARPLAGRVLWIAIPTAPALYPEDLPRWLSAECAAHRPFVADVLDRLSEPGDIVWPIDFLAALKLRREIYPRQNFHWDGETPHLLARALSRQVLGLPRLRTIPTAPDTIPSDLGRFVPGVALTIPTDRPRYRVGGIRACRGPACFPELGDTAVVINDLTRYTASDGAGGRLLILSDSFGLPFAGWFSESFAEVRHVSTNNLNRLSPDQIFRFKTALFDADRPDVLLFAYHDAALQGQPGFLSALLHLAPPPPP